MRAAAANTVVEVCSKHLTAQPIPPSERVTQAIPAGLEAIVLQCLAKEPAARIQSAAELATQLRHLNVEPWTPEQACSWWQQYREPLAQRRTRKPVSQRQGSLSVDWERRS